MTDNNPTAVSSAVPFEQTLDVVSVHDLIFNAGIGIHADELNIKQRIKISVDVGVAPATDATHEDIKRIVSYDYVIEGITQLVEKGHIKLAETLAELIAEYCLAHDKALMVRVKVAKLDRLVHGVLQVEIVRRK